MDNPVVLFDGVCNLCNTVVDFIISHDRWRQFRFASLQSAAGQELAGGCEQPEEALGTMVLLEAGRCYTRSTAALRILRRLRFPWRAVYGLIVVPPGWRDAVYEVIARHRYRWFGQRRQCRVPTAEERALFLE
jgi:predicted DCC family thiol-disulfide oxidoreductase YuxK